MKVYCEHCNYYSPPGEFIGGSECLKEYKVVDNCWYQHNVYANEAEKNKNNDCLDYDETSWLETLFGILFFPAIIIGIIGLICFCLYFFN